VVSRRLAAAGGEEAVEEAVAESGNGLLGDEVVGLFALAMSAGMTTAAFRRVVLPHPTVGDRPV
jgi:hypothetical protein